MELVVNTKLILPISGLLLSSIIFSFAYQHQNIPLCPSVRLPIRPSSLLAFPSSKTLGPIQHHDTIPNQPAITAYSQVLSSQSGTFSNVFLFQYCAKAILAAINMYLSGP